MKIRLIKNEQDCKKALKRIEDLFDSKPNTPQGDELELLSFLVEDYESKNYPIDFPDPIEAIKFRMDQSELSQRDLIPFIGNRAKVSRILSGKVPLTLKMIRALNQHLGIPAEVLLKDPGATLPENMKNVDWNKFPIKAMAKLGWLEPTNDLEDRAEEIMRDQIEQAGGKEAIPAALFRKAKGGRQNVNTDPYALRAWCYRILAIAHKRKLSIKYKKGTVNQEFLKKIATLSMLADGPRLAQEFLASNGIHLICLQHLPKTYLDGVALQLLDGTPVIGLTLRYDRLDNFWFNLLHELSHIGRHLEDKDEVFIDDLSLRGSDPQKENQFEREADEWAEEALIPKGIWEKHPIRSSPTQESLFDLAAKLNVHPAVIAGRVRFETGNYHLFSHFVGNGLVRKHFPYKKGI